MEEAHVSTIGHPELSPKGETNPLKIELTLAPNMISISTTSTAALPLLLD